MSTITAGACIRKHAAHGNPWGTVEIESQHSVTSPAEVSLSLPVLDIVFHIVEGALMRQNCTSSGECRPGWPTPGRRPTRELLHSRRIVPAKGAGSRQEEISQKARAASRRTGLPTNTTITRFRCKLAADAAGRDRKST